MALAPLRMPTFIIHELFNRHQYRPRMITSDLTFNGEDGGYLVQCDRCGAVKGSITRVTNYRS